VADELDTRMRSLEAERLRPVPAAPIPSRRDPTLAERTAVRRETAAIERLIELADAVRDHFPDDEDTR
jgi:hypothetical protein